MADLPEPERCWPSEIAYISFGGERVTHLYPNDCYYAHLSIYRFAAQFAQDGIVLDAGSGAGYGAAYLADHGARFIWGVDISARAIAFSRRHLRRRNLRFRATDLQRLSGFPRRSFDLVVCSNALEHVPDVLAFLRGVWALIKPDGIMVVAVPPVTSDESRAANLANPYHLNIWTPRQWHYALSLFLQNIKWYRHVPSRSVIRLDFGNTPDQCAISEGDFVFEPVQLEHFASVSTLSVVSVVRGPVADSQLPPPDQLLTFVDDSFTRMAPVQRTAALCRAGASLTVRSCVLWLRRLLADAWRIVRSMRPRRWCRGITLPGRRTR